MPWEAEGRYPVLTAVIKCCRKESQAAYPMGTRLMRKMKTPGKALHPADIMRHPCVATPKHIFLQVPLALAMVIERSVVQESKSCYGYQTDRTQVVQDYCTRDNPG